MATFRPFNGFNVLNSSHNQALLQKPTFYLVVVLSLLAFPLFAQLEFVENKGQWPNSVQYRADLINGSSYLSKDGFMMQLYNQEDLEHMSEAMHGHSHGSSDAAKASPTISTGKFTLRGHVFKVIFEGGNPSAQPVPEKVQSYYNNYYLGDNPAQWAAECRIYQAVTYKDVYPGIDVRYYSSGGAMKYDFIVRPGGDPKQIQLRYEGIEKLEVKNKELIIPTSIGEFKELYPYTYEVAGTKRNTLSCAYKVKGNRVHFEVSGQTPGSTLVIDPTLIFCSFTGSTQDNWGYTSTPGPDGSFYGGGIAFNGGFPSSPGAFSTSFNGGVNEDNTGPYDIAIMKLSANGTQRLYATYLGGNVNEQPHSMIVDRAGNLIVAGRSNSANYPKRFPNPTTILGGGGLYDITVTKFNATGTALLGSIMLGGSGDDGVNVSPKYVPVNGSNGAVDTRRNYGDDARSEVILDGAENIYVVACSRSNNFPTVNPLTQQPFFNGGQQDGVIMRFPPDLSGLSMSSYFGGSGVDACFVASISPVTGLLYVAGATTSSDLPGPRTGSLQPNFKGGNTDGFVTIINPATNAIVRTTYIGTFNTDATSTGNELVYGIQFDRLGFPYITGTTTGNWTALNATFSNTGGKQFIGKLNPDLSAYVYTTMFGTNTSAPNISITAFLVDRCQNVYVSGWGGSFNNGRGYPCAGTQGLPVVNAIQTQTDGNDFYFFVLERDATRQLFGSFFGQIGGFDDHVDGGTSRFDANGIIYQAICANCGGRGQPQIRYPTTPGVWAPLNGSLACNQAMVKVEMNFGGVGASIRATINGVIDTIGCVPLRVQFTDTLGLGKRYIWDFGDGSAPVTQTAPGVAHTFTRVGTYRVRLISIDSTTCNIADTAFATIRVGNNDVRPSFTAQKIGGCESFTYRFTNTSTAPIPTFGPNSFVWDFGDNSPRRRAGPGPITHTFPAPGVYQVTLLVDDTTFCNAPDSIRQPLRLAVNVDAAISTPPRGCVPYTAQFTNTSQGGLEFFWDFGDGATSTAVNPTHRYPNIGTYTIRLIARDTTTCNVNDTAFATVTVFGIPTADFSFSPNPAQENTSVQFTNLSVGANTYQWDFGDGDRSTLSNPRHLFNATGQYNVCLVAFNQAGCSDTVCRNVPALILPLLDVPNAFTPDRFGENAVLKVRGFGIARLDFRIYNRWGQQVFFTDNASVGWDGKFKGKLQPMDVYTYTLDAEFSDGKKIRKTGDITLIR